MTFKYIVGAQADRYSFIQIPKILMTDKVFSDMPNWVKITYGFLLDRMKLSVKNNWIDDKGLGGYCISPAYAPDCADCATASAVKFHCAIACMRRRHNKPLIFICGARNHGMGVYCLNWTKRKYIFVRISRGHFRRISLIYNYDVKMRRKKNEDCTFRGFRSPG